MATPAISPEYFDNIIQSINNVNACRDLQTLVGQVFPEIEELVVDINDEMEKLQPFLILANPPHDLPGVIKYLNTLSKLFGFGIEAEIKYTQELLEIATKVPQVIQAIENAQKRLTNCTFKIPTIGGLPQP